jgi:hypothetical protein
MRRLVVSSVPGELRAALFEDDVAIELCLIREDEPSLVGGIFRARVTRSLPALNGAFVEICAAQPAFLPGRPLPAEGASIIVQVVRDAFADKGPEVRRHAWPQDPGGAGVVRLDTARSPLKQLLDHYRDQFDSVVFNRQASLAEARRVLGQSSRQTLPSPPFMGDGEGEVAPAARSVVASPHPDPLRPPGQRGGVELVFDGAPDFDARTGLADAFDEAIAAELPLSGGGRIRFDDGAAFTGIDVDLGGGADSRRGAGDVILSMNLAAAKAIARHLRLRQTGGAIVIDFISMTGKEHRAAVAAALSAASTDDPNPVQVHGWTRLGHLELTRQRRFKPIADYLLSPADARQKLPVATGWDVLRALDRCPFQAGGWHMKVHPCVAELLSSRLRPYFDRIIAAQAGMPVELETDSGIPRDRFDIQPLRSHL